MTLDALLALGGPALSSASPSSACSAVGALLSRRNGFYAFESALHVFSCYHLVAWNARTCWRDAYDGLADDALFFAEDVFGNQFCIRESRVHFFDPETGDYQDVASDLDEWASILLADYGHWTGHTLARDFQHRHGALQPHTRVVPVTPFELGGAYEVDNLRATSAVEGMRYRAAIALQIRELPDGATVKLEVIE